LLNRNRLKEHQAVGHLVHVFAFEVRTTRRLRMLFSVTLNLVLLLLIVIFSYVLRFLK